MIDCRTLKDLLTNRERRALVISQARRHDPPLALLLTPEQLDAAAGMGDLVGGVRYVGVDEDGRLVGGDVPLALEGETPAPRPKPPPEPPPPPTVADENEGALTENLRTAFIANRTWLAIPSPSAGQVLAQTRALTRQTQALIRLLVARELLDDSKVD